MQLQVQVLVQENPRNWLIFSLGARSAIYSVNFKKKKEITIIIIIIPPANIQIRSKIYVNYENSFPNLGNPVWWLSSFTLIKRFRRFIPKKWNEIWHSHFFVVFLQPLHGVCRAADIVGKIEKRLLRLVIWNLRNFKTRKMMSCCSHALAWGGCIIISSC